MPKSNKLIKKILPLLLLTTFVSCYQGVVDPFDRQTGATKSDVKDVFYGDKARAKKDKKSNRETLNTGSIPQVSRIIAIPTAPRESEKSQLLSFSVTDEVPLKDVLIELAKSAKLDVDLDPTISGGVIINAKKRPLTEILDRICNMGNLRYTLVNKRLHVERDLPFPKNYTVDFLIEGDMWEEVEKNLKPLIDGDGSLLSNKLGNIITVFASQKNHQIVADYLEQARKNYSSQVLIEAKVVEVTLKDVYKAGIDWTWAGESGKSNVKLVGNTGSGNPFTAVLGSGSLLGKNLNASISALEEFGTTKAIASPRINALNNQKATLNFTKKLVYFTYKSTTNTAVGSTGNAGAQTSTLESTINEKDTGTELTITPSIDLSTQEITLDVQPKITISNDSAKELVVDPTTGDSFENLIPIINTRELKTIAKIKSGSVLVIGGVMGETTANTDKGVPFFSKLPLLGYLFRSTSKESEVTETIIFIKATIIGTGEGINKYDRNINNTFTSSSRPFLTK